jgi:16S rRNA (adenine1518-N6/adenine1519-N6)-dimethyltransferase
MTLHEEVRAALGASGFRPRKSLGQNFLVQERVLDSILRLLELSDSDRVLEIGPGLGFLTRRLIAAASHVYAVEIDDFLFQRLSQSAVGLSSRLTLVHGDILKVPLAQWLPQGKVKVAANLPYSIATPVFFRLLEEREHFSSLVLMVQKEVAERIAGSAGTKAYGTLSVYCQIHGRIVGRLASVHMPALRELVRAAFGQRRKMLGNALAHRFHRQRGDVEALLRDRNIDATRRGETLTVDEFIGLAQALSASRWCSGEKEG